MIFGSAAGSGEIEDGWTFRKLEEALERPDLKQKMGGLIGAVLLGRFGILMKYASLITTMFAASTMLFLQNMKAASTDTAFDGTWSVTLNTHDYKDPNTGQVALAYVDHFPAEIKNGILHGEYATRGLPGWLEIDGKIGADGTALLHVNALTGPSKYNFQYKGQGTPHSPPGKPYAYDVNAHFKGHHGSGKRIGGRIGIFDFAKN